MLESHQTALNELKELEQRSSGKLKIDDVNTIGNQSIFQITIDCSDYQEEGNNSLPLEQFESFELFLDENYPMTIPTVYTSHCRFYEFPHFQWLRSESWKPSICLYLSPDVEWVPSDGMLGLIDRLDDWLKNGAASNLDPDGTALHPPVVYVDNDNPLRILISKNAPKLNGPSWLGYFLFKKITETVYEITDFTEDFSPKQDHGIGPAFFVKGAFSFEFPENLEFLLKMLKSRGDIDTSTVLAKLKKSKDSNSQTLPLLVLVGTPMRGISGANDKQMHLTVWDAGRTKSGSQSYDGLSWCKFYECRPEIVTRRDENTNAVKARGKNVLLIGVGGIGRTVAECLVRAGINKLTIIDNGEVHPGLLSRQSFNLSEIGQMKATVVALQLKGINENCEINAYEENALKMLTSMDFGQFDLAIDASASNLVTTKIEKLYKTKQFPVFASAVLSGNSKNLVGFFITNSYKGGPVQLYRNLEFRLRTDPSKMKLVDLIWPKESSKNNFQPEPGCSSPTYTGSAADLLFMSGYFVRELFDLLAIEKKPAATFFGISESAKGQFKNWRLEAESYIEFDEKRRDFKIRFSKSAIAQMKSSIKQASALRGNTTETGGLIFGDIDNSLKIIWIDKITDAPTDSIFRDDLFVCGTKAVQETNDALLNIYGTKMRFVGYWHTHPNGVTHPSKKDINSAKKVITQFKKSLRQVLMLISEPQSDNFNFFLFDRQDGNEFDI